MTLFRHEMKSNRVSLLIWCGVLNAMTLLTMLLYPSFKGQMGSLSSIFSMMGPFSAALGLDVLDFNSAIGFYGIETGTMLSIGGTMFAAFTGIALLSKEEGGHTAEFLLTQPISRARVAAQKLLALGCLLILFNAISAGLGALCFAAIGEPLPAGPFLLFHLAQLLLHIEIGCVCFCLSAFARRTQVGLGLGIALLLYFLSLIINIVDAVDFLRYITPFSYAESSRILTKGSLDGTLLAVGGGVTAAAVALAFIHYQRKDIAA